MTPTYIDRLRAEYAALTDAELDARVGEALDSDACLGRIVADLEAEAHEDEDGERFDGLS